MILPMSFSSINTYSKCERLYGDRYIHKTFKPEPNEFAQVGIEKHEYAAGLIDGGADNPDFPEITKYVKQFCNLPGETKTELYLCVKEDLTPCQREDEGAFVCGIIDLLNIEGNRARIIDWKFTNKADKKTADKYKLQLDIFAFLTMACYNSVEEVSAELHWVEHDVPPTAVTYNRDSMPGIKRKLMSYYRIINHAVNNDHWPVRPSYLCRWCENYTCSAKI